MPNKMQTRCAIVDDEPLALDLLEHYVAKVPHLKLVGRCNDALEAGQLLCENTVDLLFLDIQMPDLSGISFIKSLSRPPSVIFTTAYREYAVESYEINALDYLVKPFSFERFLKAINKTPNQELSPDKIQIKAENKIFNVLINDIIYIESINESVVIHTDSRDIVSYQPLSHFERLIGEQDAMRIHRSFLVMIPRVTAFDQSSVYLGDIDLPIGKTYKEGITERLQLIP